MAAATNGHHTLPASRTERASVAAGQWDRADLEAQVDFLDDVDIYVGDSSDMVAGRAIWSRPPRAEASSFLYDATSELSYFDKSAARALSSSETMPLPIDGVPLDSPQEESLKPPEWPTAEQEGPIKVAFRVSKHDAPGQTARMEYDLRVRKVRLVRP